MQGRQREPLHSAVPAAATHFSKRCGADFEQNSPSAGERFAFGATPDA